MTPAKSRNLRNTLTGYYGVLQVTHLLTLAWAGLYFLRAGVMPFPAQPPAGGWNEQVIPFLLALGALDAAAAALGIWFAVQRVIMGKWRVTAGLISGTMALTSALVFAGGTYASGAWWEHPGGYLGMVTAFAPLLPLYLILIQDKRQDSRP